MRKTKAVDDLDGSIARETIEFGIDGQLYLIELSSANAKILRQTVKAWADRGRRAGAGRRHHTARADPWRKHVSHGERAEIREWCMNNGHRVGSRGPLPFRLVDAYRSSNRRSA